MNKILNKLLCLVLLLSPLFLITSCDADKEERVIGIGYLSSLSAPWSAATDIEKFAFLDLIQFYNEHNIIPGVHLNPIIYEGSDNPSEDVSCYEWLIDKGVDLVFTPSSETVSLLSTMVTEDKIVLFTSAAPSENIIQPPGYVFSINIFPRHEAYSLLKWIAENDPDFPLERPAKIGIVRTNRSDSESFLDGIKEYTELHPNNYELIEVYLNNSTSHWNTEVKTLRDCDYVIPPLNDMTSFINEHRNSGFKGKYIGTDSQLFYIYILSGAVDWEAINDMVIIRSSKWWNDNGEEISLIKEILFENHPGLEGNWSTWSWSYYPYLTANEVYIMLEIIKYAVQTRGSENFNSENLYEAAQSFTMSIDDVELYSFNETKRTAANFFGVYRINAVAEDLIRIDPTWYPVKYFP